MKPIRVLLGTLTVCALMMGATGCQKHEEGPAEKAGKSMDDAMNKAGEKMEQMGDDMQKNAEGK